MQFKIKNFKPVPVLRKVALELFENLPKIVLFISCFYFFFHFVYLLIQRFLDFETTVLIKYEAPKNIVFPGNSLHSKHQAIVLKTSIFQLSPSAAAQPEMSSALNPRGSPSAKRCSEESSLSSPSWRR